MNIRSIVARCRKSQEGTVLVFFAVCLAVFLGMIALSFDIGRIAITQTELQSYADNVALAAAGELDGDPGAIARATAAAGVISDKQSFGTRTGATDAQALGGQAGLTATLRFLKSLPDDDKVAANDIATGDADAKFVEAVVTEHDVDFTFGAAFAALTGRTRGPATVNARATATNTLYACDITPLMFCLPTSGTIEPGDMIRMVSGASDPEKSWGPGNFGFLDLSNFQDKGACESESGQAAVIRCLLGAYDFVSGCFPEIGVDTSPGKAVGINDISINVRFDIYNGNFGSKYTDTKYTPAPNIISGLKNGTISNGCTRSATDTSVDTIALPRDTCMAGATSTCGRFGDGVWDKDKYIKANYLDVPAKPLTYIDPAFPADPTQQIPIPPLAVTDLPDELTSAETRYELYLAEIALATEIEGRSDLGFKDADLYLTPTDVAALDETAERDRQLRLLKHYSVLGTNRQETIRPQCSKLEPAAPTPPSRRVLSAAGIDCVAQDVKGKTKNMDVAVYLEVFMTEAIGKGGSVDDIWMEVITVDTQDIASSKFQRIVELKK